MVLMDRIALFAGTTEGRQIAEFLEDFPVRLYISTATEYGKAASGKYRNAEIFAGRMDQREMEAFLSSRKVNLAVDATHPYAAEVTENLKRACRNCQVDYIRCLREHTEDSETGMQVRVDSVSSAVEYLQHTEGNILITTGSKELKEYTKLQNFRERCFARVLSTGQAVLESCALGLEGKHLFAMQGPFSREMNLALLHETNAKYIVTKDSGSAGGFPEKKAAAAEAKAVLVVIGRPKEEEGMELEEVKACLTVRAARCTAS